MRIASRWTSPTGKASAAAFGIRRYCRLWPVAGPSTTTRSGAVASSRSTSYQIFPTVMSSFRPGAAATKYW